MKIAVVSDMGAPILNLLKRIRERQDMGIKIGEVVPVHRPIDVPMAVRKMGERPDIEAILIAADFPELRMEHEGALLERITGDIMSIENEVKKPVSMELMGKDVKEGDLERALRNLQESIS